MYKSELSSPTYILQGISPIYAASEEGESEVVDILLKAGVDANQACTTVRNYLLIVGVWESGRETTIIVEHACIDTRV